MTGDVIILPVVRVESEGLRAQEDERERMLTGGRPPRREHVRAAGERAKRQKPETAE